MRYLALALIGVLGIAVGGCRDNSPPVAQVIPPDIGQDTYRREADYPKPLPAGPRTVVTTPSMVEVDPGEPPAAVAQPASEPQAFVDAYNKVNRPRLIVYVNPGTEGQLLPARDPRTGQAASVANPAAASTGVANAGLDSALVESLLVDWLGCDGRVNIVPPSVVHSKIDEAQAKAIQAGKADVLPAVGSSVQGHVWIQVQARVIKNTEAGPEMLLYAEAVNVQGGDLLAQATVHVSSPQNRSQLNSDTRTLAQELMTGIARTWLQPAPQSTKDSAAPAPAREATIPISEEPRSLGAGKLPPPLPPPPIDK